MQGNIIGQSGMFVKDSLFPIYQQLNQPVEYNGIWIKTEDNLKDVYFQTDDVRDYELINDLPYDFDGGRATSIGSDIYLFGGAESSNLAQNAYKYNSIEKTYTKLANIPSAHYFDEGAIVLIDEDIYLVGIRSIGSGYVIHKYSPINNTYTNIMSMYNFEGGTATVINNDIYCFGSENKRQTAIKYNISSKESTALRNIPGDFFYGSAIAINENEIMLLGVDGRNNTHGTYKYNISENKYYIDKVILGKAPSNTKINNFSYVLEKSFVSTEYNVPILTKYGLKNNSIYQYGESCKSLKGSNNGFFQVVNANNDLYILTDLKLYEAKIIAGYKGDGIYVISQETFLSKDLDVKNVLDVKKIVDGEEQDILVYIGDGTSWKLLNGSDTTQNTNALQYALNFKEEK